MDDGEGCLALIPLLATAPLPAWVLARRLADGELGRTLRLLARSRLVSRTVDPLDRRRTLVAITPLGLARLGEQ
ncbi:hypothetical protein GCM10023148_40530 [Actinokineospora soli]